MRVPRQLFIVVGSAAIIASIAMAGLSFSISHTNVAIAGTGDPDPTIDPCEESVNQINPANDLRAAAQGCISVTSTKGPAKTHTPTVAPTDEPTEAVTEAPEVTNTPAPVATSTPSGGAGAGGVQPPNTGAGDAGTSSALQWLAVAGALALLVGGAGSLVFGLRRK